MSEKNHKGENHKAGEPQEPTGEVKLTKKGDGAEVGMYSKEEQEALKEQAKAEKAEEKAEKKEDHKK
jgi:hypothetical protein